MIECQWVGRKINAWNDLFGWLKCNLRTEKSKTAVDGKWNGLPEWISVAQP